MKRALLIAAWLLAATGASAQTREWRFRVLLDDAEIGRHRFTLREDGTGRELRSEARFEVRFLAIPVYRYEHEAIEQWRDGCLRAQRYRLRAPGLRIDLWLDDGQWVALESAAKGDRRLRYELL